MQVHVSARSYVQVHVSARLYVQVHVPYRLHVHGHSHAPGGHKIALSPPRTAITDVC